MNPLFQISRSDILERKLFRQQTFVDRPLLMALERYDIDGSTKSKAIQFISSLAPLWQMYRKESFLPIFQSFIHMELGLEMYSTDYISHANHVIQEFLLGYNILVNCAAIKKKYHYRKGRGNSDSTFGDLFFAWMAASLLHDVGYDIEKSPDEEDFRERKNVFWDFMTSRATTRDSLTFSPSGPGRRIIDQYLLPYINSLVNDPKLTSVQFEELFITPIENKDWVKYDHGVISAVKYLVELEKLEKSAGGTYLGWEPNIQAAIAMALHNFRYKDLTIKLDSSNYRTLIAYLLIVCDEIQEWERERFDSESAGPKDGRHTRKTTELMGITFRDKHCYIVLNHKLKDVSFTQEFENYLHKKLISLKRDFPVKILSSQSIYEQVRDSLIKELKYKYNESSAPSEHTVKGFKSRLHEALDFQQEIKNIKTEKNLLQPSEPLMYEIYVDHRIDGDPYLTVVFPI